MICFWIESNADNEGNYVVKVDGIDISPNPVVSGKPASFSISASTGQAISGGKAAIDVSYFGIHIHQETHPLCEETSCPIAVGNFVLSHNQVLPGFAPPVSFTYGHNFFFFFVFRIFLRLYYLNLWGAFIH